MKRLRQTILVFTTAITLLGGVIWNSAAAADSNDPNNPSNNPIGCGLWTGANLQFYPTVCPPDSSSASAAGQNTPSVPQQGGATPAPASGQIYAALGDSVAAGLGLPGISGGSSQDVQCGRSYQAYPYIVAQSTGLSLINQTCSGATAGDLFTQQHVSGPNPAAQLDGAYAQGVPQLITITAGANDARWASFIRACYSGDCARPSFDAAANAFLVALQAKMYYLFYNIQSRSNSGQLPRVIVTGYYNPISAQCANLQQQITPNEITWLTAETNALNKTLQNVTSQFSFAQFVPVNFTGHDICSNTPWVQGLNDPAPFHPTAVGQQAIARSVLQTMGY